MKLSTREKIDVVFKQLFRTTGLLTIAILAGIFLMLIYNSIAFFLHVQPLDFITRTQWSPTNNKNAQYGILPLLVSTALVTVGAMIIAVPLGIGTASFISEYTGKKVQNILKPLIEMLASIPSVAVG